MALAEMSASDNGCVQVHCKITSPAGGPSTHISLTEGDYFGELALQGAFKSASSLQADHGGAWAMSLREEEFSNCCGLLKELISQACTPTVLSRETLCGLVGSLVLVCTVAAQRVACHCQRVSVQDQEWKQLYAKAAETVVAEMPTIPDTSLEDCLVRSVFVRGACQMVVQLEVPSGNSIEVVTARVFQADAAVALGHNTLISRQRDISRQLGPSVFVPMTGGVLRSVGACAEVLVTSGSATLSQLLASSPLDVASTQFLVAGIIVRLCS